jgi:hypothetical protein
MMRATALAVTTTLAAIALSVGAGWAAAAPASQASTADEASLRVVSADEVAAFMAVDTPRLGDLWADGFVVNNPLNQLVTKPQVLGMVSSGMLRFTSYDRRIEYVRTYGDIAVVAGSEAVVWAGRMPLAGQLSHLRFMAVWQRSGKSWVEVARQANVVPDAPGPTATPAAP